MRYKGLILVILLVSFALVAKVVLAGGKAESIQLAPEKPVIAECRIENGTTIVKIVAVDDVSSISVVAGDESFDIADGLQKGWSVSRVFSGVDQSVTLKFVWRGTAESTPVLCQ